MFAVAPAEISCYPFCIVINAYNMTLIHMHAGLHIQIRYSNSKAYIINIITYVYYMQKLCNNLWQS